MLFTNLVQANLKTRTLGQQIEYYTRLESTNTEAWELINNGCDDGTVIITDNQYSGKGRGSRTWSTSSDKSLTFSIVIFPDITAKFSNWIPIITSLALQRALSSFSTKVKLKYPNDIFYNRKKICGLLQELITQDNRKFLIVGIGLNIITNPNINNVYKATNIYLETKKKPSIIELINLIRHDKIN